MQALILCAGRGSRLGQRTDATPKALLPIAGKPLLHHTIEKLLSVGFSDIVLVVGHLGHLIEESCRQFPTVRYVKQSSPRGTADAVLAAELVLDSAFLLTYGDMWISTRDYNDIAHLYAQDAVPRIGMVEMMSPRGAAVYLQGNCVRDIIEKPIWNGPADTHWNACGLFTLGRDILDSCHRIGPSVRSELELTGALQASIQRGAHLSYYCLRDNAVDIGTPEHYDALCATLNAMPKISN